MSNETTGLPADQPDWERVARYLAGESSAEEIAAVERWLAEDPARQSQVDALGELVARARLPEPPDVDVEGALAAVRERIAEPPVHSLEERRATATLRPRSRLVAAARVAAVLVLFLGGALLFRSLLTNGPAETRAPGARYVTATGERQELVLADGTRALLGPRSELIVEPGYGLDHSFVALTGEAHFQVAAAAAGLFTVRAGGAVVRDLGTAFNVRTAEGGVVEVVVTEGSVSLHREVARPRAEVVLFAGDRAVMEPRGEIARQRGGASADDLAWTRGELVFREAPMQRVAEDLRRWYGLEVRLADDALAERRLTASFHDESPEEVRQIIGLALGIQAELRDDTLTLGSGRSHR